VSLAVALPIARRIAFYERRPEERAGVALVRK